MSTPSPDYMQQLFAYLQAGQQLLQQWIALMGSPPPPANPFAAQAASPTGQPMPSAPFTTPPVPTSPDYAQQLFSYLQAWRQYLEQTAAGSPVSPQAPAPAPPFGGPLQTGPPHHHGSDIPTKSPDVNGSKSNMLKDTSTESTPRIPPDLVAMRPAQTSGTQGPLSDVVRPQMIPPFMDNGNQIDSLGEQVRGPSVAGTPPGATAFQSLVDRVDRGAVQPMNAQSLFSQRFEIPSG